MKKQLIIKGEVVEMTFAEVLEVMTPAIYKEINRQKSTFNHYHEEVEDMFQGASLWLWKAYQKYDIEKGYHFSTYAHRYISKGAQYDTFKHKSAKHSGSVVSLDQSINEDNDCSLSNFIKEEFDYDGSLIAKEVINKVSDILSEDDIDYLKGMMNGYTQVEMANIKGTTRQNAYFKYNKIKAKIKVVAENYEYLNV